MAGRPITNHSEAARRKRERTRQLRALRKEQERPPVYNPRPLTRAIQHWRAQ